MFDTDDDVSLRGRRMTARDAVRERADVDDHQPEREVTLNTGTVLALFFTLALICAVFFGFGYSMGRKSVPSAPAPIADTSDSVPISNGGNKPSSASVVSEPIPSYSPQPQISTASKSATATTVPVAESTPASLHTASLATPAPATRTPAATTPVATPVHIPPTAVTPAAAGSMYVQVAAVSHQEDADVLRSALTRRGYKVLERNDANDHLIHVQIGPFSDRKAADAMRQRLLGDGYNAFIK